MKKTKNMTASELRANIYKLLDRVIETGTPLEIERIRQPGRIVVDELAWTRDPFDRLICAQALADAAPLLTADRTVHEHLDMTVWD